MSVKAHLEVTARNTGVRQAELCILATADHIGALTQLIGAATAVVQLQRDGGAAAAGTTGGGAVIGAALVAALLVVAVLRFTVATLRWAIAALLRRGAVTALLRVGRGRP